MPKRAAFFSHRYVLWLILALPGVKLVWPFFTGGFVPPAFLGQSGEWAIRFLIVTLALTPLQRIFRKSRFVHWFVRRRRYFGVASFGYATLHVGYYLWELIDLWGTAWLTRALFTATSLYAWTGWLAIAIYLPLALTSNQVSQRGLGRWWKGLQRLTYVAALAAAIHWLLLANTPATWLQLGVLALLEIARLGLGVARSRTWSSR